MQLTEIKTDETLRELTPHGTAAFPFEYYYDDIHKYDKQFIDWHWHREFEWVYVEQGVVNCFVGNERIELASGDGIFINADVIHKFESPHGAIMPNILFAPEFIAAAHTTVYEKYVCAILNAPFSFIPLRSNILWQRDLIDRVRDICMVFQSARETAKFEVQIKTCQLWQAFYTHHRELSADQTADCSKQVQARMRKMLCFIKDHYQERITLADIARSADVSKSEALRCFHSSVQDSPISYLNSYRLHQAKKILLSTDDKISSIALRTGFDNISYFNRLFKEYYDLTPRALRNSSVKK